MVVCKFFLQGDCRFGDSCKFEHQYNDNRQQHSSIIRQQTFNPTNTNSPGAPVDTNTLVRSVSNDMITVEKSGQWLLSCYAPFKEKSLFPGFEDHSFEEIRYGYYNAKSSGSLDAYPAEVRDNKGGAGKETASDESNNKYQSNCCQKLKKIHDMKQLLVRARDALTKNKYAIFGSFVADEISQLRDDSLKRKLKKGILKLILEISEEDEAKSSLLQFSNPSTCKIESTTSDYNPPSPNEHTTLES